MDSNGYDDGWIKRFIIISIGPMGNILNLWFDLLSAWGKSNVS